MKHLFFRAAIADIWADDPRNGQLTSLWPRLSDLCRSGALTDIDTSGMSDDERFSEYLKCLWPTAKHHYRVRTVFGTNRYPAVFFGKQVPALLLLDDEGLAQDVFPHQMRGAYITIAQGLATI